MRFLLSIFFAISVAIVLNGCNATKNSLSKKHFQPVPGYQFIIRAYDNDNDFNEAMNVFTKYGATITRIERISFISEAQGIKVSIGEADKKIMDDIDMELRSIKSVLSVSIERI